MKDERLCKVAQARWLIMLLAETLHIDPEQALDIFYSTEVYRQVVDPKYGLQLMSDGYILENLMEELKNCKEQK